MKLSFVGDGPQLAAVRDESRQLGIGESVSFLGERFDIAAILSQAHIFALASNWEGFPLSILEAMRAGLPVIASDVGGVAEAVVDGVTGFLIPSGDLNALQARLSTLVESPSLRRTMGKSGRARYEADFTLEQMLQKTLAVYQKALLGADVAHRISSRATTVAERSHRVASS